MLLREYKECMAMNANDKNAARADIKKVRKRLNPNNIVLIGDFLQCAVEPAMKNGDTFEQVFGRDGNKIIKEWLKVSLATKLTYFNLKDVGRGRADRKILAKAEHLYESRLNTLERRFGDFVIYSDSRFFITDETIASFKADKEAYIEEQKVKIREEYTELATYADDLVKAMRTCLWFSADGVSKFDERAIVKNEVQVAIDFWKAFNGLDMYNEHVEGPRSGPPPNSPRNPVIGWRPMIPQWVRPGTVPA